MVRIDYRRALSMLRSAISRLSAAGRWKRFAFAVAAERRERGQTLLEFSLVIPILLIFLLIVVDFGLAMGRRVVLQHAVREGARKGATGAEVLDIQTTTADQLGLKDLNQVLVCYKDTDGDGQFGEVGDDVQVTADVVYKFATGTELVGIFGVNPEIKMKPSADMRLETRVPVSGAAQC
jgi:Flp pilus assembly protein TadG